MIPPCSQPEREVLASLATDLQERGYAVDVEDFAARPSNEPWLAAFAGLAVVAALAVYVAPLVTALLGFVAVVLHARDSEGRPLLRRDSCAAANVVARAPSAVRPLLVVVTPAVPHPRRFAYGVHRALVTSLHVSMVAVAAGGAAAWVAEAETELPVPVAAGGALLAGAIAVASIFLYGSSGRPADRPATLDLLVRLAPALRDHAVWLVATGGRRGGLAGIQALLADHPETGGAWWLNLEPGEDDEVFAVSEEGTWRERRAHRFLLGAVEGAGAEVKKYRGVPTDATALLARHRRALTLLVPEHDLARAGDLALAAADSLD
jgi:hypothetical protein